MKSIQRRFNDITNKNPHWSSYICFAEAIKEQGFGKESISIWFNKLVEKDDYDKKDKKDILTKLYVSSNVRDGIFRPKSLVRRTFISFE